MTAISIEQAQAIVAKAFLESAPTITSISEIPHGYSFTSSQTSYILDLALGSNVDATHSSFLVVSTDDASPSGSLPNSLSLFPQLLNTIRSNTSIPIPSPILDETRSVIPHTYLITPIYPIVSTHLISLAQARESAILSAQQSAVIDLQLGQWLGELHKGAQNDYFGLPSATTPADPSYDWQDTFVALLEEQLDLAATRHPELPIDGFRATLGRAISAFLWSDVDVPSLVWFTGSPDDVFLAFTPSGQFSAFALLPAFAHAVWGDPLLETFFIGASNAFWEGYRAVRGEQDSAIMVFPRQRTKRVWYDVFLALVVLNQRDKMSDDKTSWALDCLHKSAETLKNAPVS
ncbi:hypothetical protein HMN09_00540800 [Mycena chlorophos]|uniref:Aminoglycoside phosphotransferase domain-containing protein n=1 Tax=Mycena chlorophos TaxID=658473 RepID=A0A8H6WGC5_MYCCL|nr:hypothetical protein HMN09_00540800 [Mycena chlorophos]